MNSSWRGGRGPGSFRDERNIGYRAAAEVLLAEGAPVHSEPFPASANARPSSHSSILTLALTVPCHPDHDNAISCDTGKITGPVFSSAKLEAGGK